MLLPQVLIGAEPVKYKLTHNLILDIGEKTSFQNLTIESLEFFFFFFS